MHALDSVIFPDPRERGENAVAHVAGGGNLRALDDLSFANQDRVGVGPAYIDSSDDLH